MTELLPVNVRLPSKRVERESRDRSEEGGEGSKVMSRHILCPSLFEGQGPPKIFAHLSLKG